MNFMPLPAVPSGEERTTAGGRQVSSKELI